MPTKGVFPSTRVVQGVVVKRCTGCGKEKPIEKFYKRGGKRKGWHSLCKLCYSLRSGGHAEAGLVPLAPLRFALTELVRRVGKAEAARRIGTTLPNLWKWMNMPPEKIKRTHARGLMLALTDARERDEVRHRDDILNGAEIRGKTVRMATRRDELYHSYHDTDASHKKKQRKKPGVRKRENEAQNIARAKRRAATQESK